MAIRIDTSFKLRGYIESLIGGRAENQDSAGALETAIGTVITVCDGMGGLNGGKTASMLAVKTIIDDVAEASAKDSPAEVLKKAIIHANKVIIAAGLEDTSLKGMGTTVTAVIINRNAATVAHLGDSRIYQIRSGGKVFRTNDHSKVFELVKAGMMTEEQARTADNSNVILQALGVYDEVDPEIHTLPYLSGDRFVLCSDGFWGAQCEKDFLKMISAKGNISDTVKKSVKVVDLLGIKAGGHHDNLTVAVFDTECDSKLTTPMKKSVKITIAFLGVLLLASLSLNALLFLNRPAQESAQNTDTVAESIADITGTNVPTSIDNQTE